MADHFSTPNEVEDELSAYLDGELDAEGVRRVEERLARDADYHRQLQEMERAWGLLDRLPRASVGEEFTKTTLEMVALSAAEDAREVTRQLPRQRQRQRLAGVISMVAALLVGFAIGNQVWPDPNEQLLRDLPLLENLDLYYQADDIEFLRMLDEKHLFDEGDSEHAG